MSENSEFEAQEQPATEPAPAVEGAGEGEYSEGDYGTAGSVEKPAGAGEGEYPEGDYGTAGTAGENPLGAGEGEYGAGDFGAAGTAGAEEVPAEHRLVEDEVPLEDEADEEDEDQPRDPA